MASSMFGKKGRKRWWKPWWEGPMEEIDGKPSIMLYFRKPWDPRVLIWVAWLRLTGHNPK